MKYFILLTDEAKRDLQEIEHYSLDHNSSIKYIKNILSRIELLESFPYLGLEIKNQTFSFFVIRYLITGNHIVYYKINEIAKCIYVYAIVSQSSNWKTLVNKDNVSPKIIIARSDRVEIVTMDFSMVYDVWRNSLDSDNRTFVPDEVFETLEEANAVVEQIIKNYETKDGPFIYAVIRKEDQANLGYVQLIKIEEGYEIGYHIAKLYTGRGYATEAVNLFLDYLKKNTELDTIIGIALANNKASRRVLEKCGFTLIFEGRGLYQGRKRKIIRTIKHL